MLGRSRGHLGLFLASTAAGLRPRQGRGLRRRGGPGQLPRARRRRRAGRPPPLQRSRPLQRLDRGRALRRDGPGLAAAAAAALLCPGDRASCGGHGGRCLRRGLCSLARRGQGVDFAARSFQVWPPPRPPASRPAQAADLAARRRGPPSPLRLSPGAGSGKRPRRRRSCRTM